MTDHHESPMRTWEWLGAEGYDGWGLCCPFGDKGSCRIGLRIYSDRWELQRIRNGGGNRHRSWVRDDGYLITECDGDPIDVLGAQRWALHELASILRDTSIRSADQCWRIMNELAEHSP